MAIKVAIDDRKMRRFVAAMPKASKRAQARSLNKAITRSRTFAKTEISKKRNIKAGRVLQDLKLYRASATKPQAAIVAKGETISVMDVKGAKRQTRKGVTAKLTVGEKPHLFEGAFIAKMESGHVGVFVRKKSDPRKIREVRLPSVAATMVQEELEARMHKFGASVYELELLRLLKLEMEKAAR